MGRHAAAGGEDALGGVHAVNVFWAGFEPHKNYLAALRLHLLRLVGGEHDLARGGAGRGRQPGGEHVPFGGRVDGRVQQLVERRGIDPRHRLFVGDQPLVGEFHRDAQRRFAGPLAGARLQHPQLAAFDGEFQVLHVAVMPLQQAVDAGQLREGRRHGAFQRRLVGACGLAGDLGDFLRGADAGDHILALGIDQEFAVERLSPVEGLRVKATPVADVSPRLPNTMAWTLTAVPQLSGMACRRR